MEKRSTITADDVVFMSHEVYMKDSIRAFESAHDANMQFFKLARNFETDILAIKQAYRMRSTESEGAEVKVKFGSKIKAHFLKAWEFIVTIFQKIIEMIVSLVKSLIIYVSKKRIQVTSVFKLFEKHGGITGYNNTHNNIIVNALTEKNILRTYTIKNQKITHSIIGKILSTKSTILSTFVNTKIVGQNMKSVYNVAALKDLVKSITQEQGDDNTEEMKLRQLETVVDALYTRGIMFNEVSEENANDPLLAKIKEIPGANEALANRKVDVLANLITFQSNEIRPDTLTLSDYFDVKGGRDIWFSLRAAFKDYYEMSKAVVNPGGFIDTLEKVIKEYNKYAREDYKNITALKKEIVAEIHKFANEQTPEASRKMSNFNRFTRIVSKVKSIKLHFVRLRQSVIINILKIYGIENYAWYLLTDQKKNLKDKYTIGSDERKRGEEEGEISEMNIITVENDPELDIGLEEDV